MIEIRNLTYEYIDKRALDDVSFTIQEGSITALVGPNGSGKTTLLRSMAALSNPISGDIIINGYDARLYPREVHMQIGYLQDLFGLYDQLTVAQSMEFMAYSRLGSDVDIDAAIELAVKRSEIESFIHKKVSSLSRGMRQRVGIAQAIIHQPKILLLDEPASGLDPEARHALSTLLLELRDSGMTIIVSSHILAELEDYSTDMLVIQEGTLVEHRKLDGEDISIQSIAIEAKINGLSEEILDSIKTMNGVLNLRSRDKLVQMELQIDLISKHAFLKELITRGIEVSEFYEPKKNLQDEYIKTVSNYKQAKTT